jgi:hypothetical protein
MLSNRLAFAALGIACVAAAGGGGYLATRQNAVPTPASAQTVALSPAATPAAAATVPAASRPVQETEAIVGDAKTPASAPKPPSIAAAPKKPEPPAKNARSATATNARHDAPPPLTSTWPTSAASQPHASAPAPVEQTPPQRPLESVEPPRAAEPPRAPEPPQRTFDDLVIARDSVIGLQTENRISSETAKVEDRVDARVTRDVRVGDRVAIPAGSRAVGSVSLVERGGKFKERARLGVRFHTLVLADGTRVPINTETIYRDGDAPSNSSAAKIGGGAIGGAIIGAILGGGKGAAIGATAGAGAGGAATMAGERSAVVLPPGTALTARINQPVTITIER